MASEVDICNLALGYLGDDATVASIDPPEGSAQAEHCSRFYPIARDMMLQAHTWSFSMRRVTGALLTSESSVWEYAYALPGDCLRVLAVIPPDATDDITYLPLDSQQLPIGWYVPGAGAYTSQPFTIELNSSGAQMIYTNLENAIIRYQARVTDTTRFSPMLVNAIAAQLASMIAGPLIKGKEGTTASLQWFKVAMQYLEQAKGSDANQQHKDITHVVSWISGR